MATLTAWPPQRACRPNQMLPTNRRIMTGTGPPVSRGRTAQGGGGAQRRNGLTVGAAHAPGETAADGVADVVHLAHPATGHGKHAGDDAADELAGDAD